MLTPEDEDLLARAIAERQARFRNQMLTELAAGVLLAACVWAAVLLAAYFSPGN